MNSFSDISQTVLELSSAMLAAAREGDFETVRGMDIKRRQLVEQLFLKIPEGEEGVQSLRQVVEQIQTLDSALMQLIRQERDQAAHQLQQLKKQNRASRAYQTVDG
ncbi:MAG: hypothetical protein AXA67_09655 [Methylothermaceae bacteria B42]|nr:MAG: hypothetical protein AXA67_09655 [Methylothermaceae bacteria B42]HHJ39568.1 flagellar protein FliT [Methylothermaceae bacterium]